MTLRLRLMVTFTAIILVVSLVMGTYHIRLMDKFFREGAKNQLVEQARSMEAMISRLGVSLADLMTMRSLVSVAGSVTSSRILVTDSKGFVLFDSVSDQLQGQIVASEFISGALESGRIETFDFPAAGFEAVGAAAPWRTGQRISGVIILIRPLALSARQSTAEVARFMVRSALVASAIGLFLAYALALGISLPLRKMATAAQAISKGDFGKRVDVESQDEMGDLARAMNSMSGEIETLIQDLTKERDKLSALATQRQNMLSDISHDLRTPITSIKGFVEALQDGVITGEEERRRSLSIIHDESSRLARLVEDLFYLARLESGEIPSTADDVSVSDMIRACMDAVVPQTSEKHVAFQFTDESDTDDKAIVLGSSDRLTRAVLNLLDNAIKYSPEGGTIRVSVKGTLLDGKDHVLLEIEDEGPGIPPEDLPHLFERFYRADKSRSRTKSSAGLGLSIAHLIVKQHGGEIWAENREEGGAVFSIALPRAARSFTDS